MVESYDDVQYCKWHPKVETGLACYQCGTPICTKCAHRTPVGYICPECMRGRKQRYEQSRPMDYAIAAGVAAVLALITSIIPLVGWYVILLSPTAGTGIGEIVWRAVGRRYGVRLWLAAAGGLLLGSLPLLAITALNFLGMLSLGHTGYATIDILWVGLHLVLLIGSTATRLQLT